PRVEGAVVTDLVRPTGGRADVEAVAAIVVVGLPGRVGCLKEEVRTPIVIAYDEHDVAGAAGIESLQFGDVDAGNGVRRHHPRGRLGPVAAVDQTCRGVGQTRRLVYAGVVAERRYLARPKPSVIPQAVNIDPERRRRRLHLEVYGLADVDADVGCKTLKGAVARSRDVPFRAGRSGLAVLAHDRVWPALGREGRIGRLPKSPQQGNCEPEPTEHKRSVLAAQWDHGEYN